MTKCEFNNIKWLQKEERLSKITFSRKNIIIDEVLLTKNINYEEVIKIYYQLRKNYEFRLLFNETSPFFIGEMECKRKLLASKGNHLEAFGYWLYKWMAFYGEGVRMPLAIWTPIVIAIFSISRFFPEYSVSGF